MKRDNCAHPQYAMVDHRCTLCGYHQHQSAHMPCREEGDIMQRSIQEIGQQPPGTVAVQRGGVTLFLYPEEATQ